MRNAGIAATHTSLFDAKALAVAVSVQIISSVL
jgi:hypothetical protein